MEVDLYLSTICRLCAENNPNGVYLFENSSPEDLRSFINTYLPFKVQNDGKLPQTICPGCNIQLQATVQFFDLVIEGQKKLRDMFKEQVCQRRRAEKELSDGSREVGEHSYSQEEGEYASMPAPAMDPLLQEVDEQLKVDGFEEGMYASDDPLVLKAAGLEKPRKKRGRPKKVVQPVVQVHVNSNSSNFLDENSPTDENLETCSDEPVREKEEKGMRDDDAEGRRRRKRKVPLRYKEAVQGKELERMFKEEGVIDEEDDKELVAVELVDEIVVPTSPGPYLLQDKTEVIGHLETQEGQDLGEVIVVSKTKARRKYPIRKKIRFQCEICGRGFLHHGRYMYHKSVHKGVKFECTSCQKRFSTKDNFELHQKISGHTGEGIIESLEDESGEGKSPEEVKPVDVSCKHCEQVFTSKRTYENHLVKDHQESKPFMCEVCQKSFSHQASLKAHLQSHDEALGKEKGYPCNLCGKKLNHPSSVLYHREAEHNNGRRFVCNKCGKSFKHKQLLQRHQLVHSDNRPFSCSYCSANFKTKANLMNHLATHTGEKKHKCEHCGQQFAHKTSLTLHYRWHSGQKPYQCSVCKKMFSQKGNLQEHHRIHTGEKPFHCNICSRKFTTSSQYKLHVKRHTGERPWKCEYCGKSFLHKDAWKCHIRRHKGEKPFQCPHCTRDFPEQWALKKHMRLHTGERPYSCTICGKTFADCSNLTKHKKVHAREQKQEEEQTTDGLDLSVWQIIQTHLQENSTLDKGPLKQSDDVQQIIYVAYQQDELKENDKFVMPELGVPLQEEALTLASQLVDDQGQPLQLMTDGSNIQITSDGQNVHLTTKDGQMIPVQLVTTSDTDMPPLVSQDLAEEQLSTVLSEYTSPDGQKFKIIHPYIPEAHMDSEYLNIA